MIVFYARVSTIQQNIDRQIETAKEIKAEKLFIDKCSGKNTSREQLKEMLSFVRCGDVVVVSDISRLARNTKDLLEIVETLTNKGVEFKSLKESIDTTTPQGKFMLSVWGAMAEMQREYILETQREGIELAKQRGAYKGRKEKKLDDEKFISAVKQYREGKRTATSIMREFNISSPTFYRRIEKMNI